MLKHILLLILISFGNCILAQQPKIVRQENFENGINIIHQSPDGINFLVEEGEVTKRFSIWDQASKIMLGSIEIDPGNSQGAGHINFLNNGESLISTNHSILKANLIKEDTASFINVINYPEFHLVFEIMPWDSTKIIISTKIYGDKNENIDDVTNNGRILVYDVALGEVILSKNIDFEVTEISFNEKNKTIALGTNKGECILFDDNYIQKDRFKLSQKPILFLDLSVDNLIISNANYSEDHSYTRGIGEIVFINTISKKITKVELEPQSGPKVEYGMEYGDDNLVNTIIVNPKNKELFVNYGHSIVDRIELSNFNLTHINIPKYESIAYINFNKDSTQFMIAHGKLNIMGINNQLSFFDIEKEKKSFEFKSYEDPQESDNFYFTYDHTGNYNFLTQKGKHSSYGKTDTLVIYSSNQAKNKEIICENCNLKFNPENNLLTVYNRNETYTGKLNISELDQVSYFGAGTTLPKPDVFKLINKFENKVVFGESVDITDIEFLDTTDSSFVVTATKFHKKKYLHLIYIIQNGSVVFNQESGDKPKFKISANKRYIAFSSAKTITSDKKINLFDRDKNKIIFTEKFNNFDINYFDFDVSKSKLYLSLESYKNDEYEGSYLYFIDPLQQKLEMKRLNVNQEFFKFVVDEENRLIAGELYDNLFVYDMSYHKLIYNQSTKSSIKDVFYIDKLNSFGFNLGNQLHIYKDLSNQVDFYTVNGKHEAIITNSGYYYIDKDVIKNFGFSILNKGYSFTDFDYYFNRPDIVYEILGGHDEKTYSLLSSVNKKRSNNYLSHKKEFGDIISRDLPQLFILDKSKIVDYTTTNYVELTVNSIDKNYSLEKMHVLVNGVPIFGRKGKSFNVSKNEWLKEKFKIELTSGVNKIKIYSENSEGNKSLSEIVEIRKNEVNKKPDLHIAIISVSEYLQDDMNLKYAVKDGRDMANTFSELNKEQWENIYVDTLFNSNATIENVTALKEKLNKTNVNDHVILYVSGHGLLDDNLDFYFASHDVDFENPAKRGVSYDLLEDLLDAIPARKKLFMMDACHSGEVDKEELEAINTIDNTAGIKSGIKSYSYRGAIAKQTGKSKTKTSLLNSFELMQELFTNLNEGSGAVVISAAAGDSYALESSEWNNGVFTYSVLNGLKNMEADANSDGSVTVSELRKYVINQVQDLTDGKQKPTSRQENVEFDFIVW